MRKFYSMKNLAIALVVALAMPATVQAEKGDIQLKFSTISSSASKQRAYLDEIKVVKNSTDGISAISVQKSDSKVYDLLGRSASKSGKGLRIINGKKVIF